MRGFRLSAAGFTSVMEGAGRVAAFEVRRAVYPVTPPFHPPTAHPEYAFGDVGEGNCVYDGVRELFYLLGLDRANVGRRTRNPLGDIVRPGDKVVVKPNCLWQAHKYCAGEWEQVITHGSVIRAVVDYIIVALKGRGEIWITDGPQLDADWEEILRRTGLDKVCEWYRHRSSVPVRLLDLRDTWEDRRGDVLYGTKSLPGDPAGGVEVNLGARSRFVGCHRSLQKGPPGVEIGPF